MGGVVNYASVCMHVFYIAPQAFSAQCLSPTLPHPMPSISIFLGQQYYYVIGVVTNSAHTTLTQHALNFFLGRTLLRA